MAKKRTPQKGSIAAETDLKKLKNYHNMFIALAVLFMITGICFFPFLFVGVIFIIMAIQVNKRKKEVLDQQLRAEQIKAKRLQEEAERVLKEKERLKQLEEFEEKRWVEQSKKLKEERIEKELKQEERKRAAEFEAMERKERREQMPEEELNRLKCMCSDIYKEYKVLMKKYSKLDDCEDDFDDVVEENVYILKECNRKLNVVLTTIYHNEMYDDIDYSVTDELEKVEKKAKSFINAYIKYQREENYYNDDLIDVLQFADDLDFISEYIYEKDEKLNK